jgi:hypothetical protein
VPVDREAIKRASEAYCDALDSLAATSWAFKLHKPVYNPGEVDVYFPDKQRNRAIADTINRLQKFRGSDGFVYIVNNCAAVRTVEEFISIKYGLVETIFGCEHQGTLHVCGSPLYIRHVGNMTSNIKGEPLYVMDHTVRELLAEKN